MLRVVPVVLRGSSVTMVPRTLSAIAVRSIHSSTFHLQLPYIANGGRSTSKSVDRTPPIVSRRVVGHSLLLPYQPQSHRDSSDTVTGLDQTLKKLDVVHQHEEAHAKYVLANPPEKKRNMFQRLWHDYGYVGVGTYLSVYVGTLGMLYVAIRSGLLGADTVIRMVSRLGMESHFEDLDPRKGDFLMAWVATKLTEPIRAVVTMAITPKLARMVGMAPPKKSEKKAAAQLKSEPEKK